LEVLEALKIEIECGTIEFIVAPVEKRIGFGGMEAVDIGDENPGVPFYDVCSLYFHMYRDTDKIWPSQTQWYS